MVLIPDNDDAGREGMMRFGERVSRRVKRLRWLELSDLKAKGDVSDWLDQTNTTADGFLSLVSRSAKDWPEVISLKGSSEEGSANNKVDSAIEELNRGQFLYAGGTGSHCQRQGLRRKQGKFEFFLY